MLKPKGRFYRSRLFRSAPEFLDWQWRLARRTKYPLPTVIRIGDRLRACK